MKDTMEAGMVYDDKGILNRRCGFEPRNAYSVIICNDRFFGFVLTEISFPDIYATGSGGKYNAQCR